MQRPADWKSAIQQVGNLRYGELDATLHPKNIHRKNIAYGPLIHHIGLALGGEMAEWSIAHAWKA